MGLNISVAQRGRGRGHRERPSGGAGWAGWSGHSLLPAPEGFGVELDP